jgi:hypothetical protein
MEKLFEWTVHAGSCGDHRSLDRRSAGFLDWIPERFTLHRAVKAPGMALAILVPLYVCARFGFEIAGVAEAIAIVALFGCAEAILVRAAKPAAL